MCGIAGKVSFTGKSVSAREIAQMTKAIKHRGPDDEGAFISNDRKVGLGHRRLSIIDLSALGHQPMSYINRYQIVFNGEIYNFLEKRREMIREGYRFKSHTDTEVIMALYDKYGIECLSHLRGMFAFVIYDQKNDTLFCTRDRVGKKPFKYYIDGKVFIFASELKAILTQPEYIREPDYIAIHHYLTYQYCPSPLTGFKGISKLESGHYLLLDIKTGKLVNKRYWKLDYSKKMNFTENEWKKIILSKLEESTKLRMISDVPLGAFLSGGIDSSAVVAMMAKYSNRPVKTFSIGFNEKKFDELPYAKIIAQLFKTDHTEYIVKPDTIEILPYLVKQYEEPFADSSALPTYFVSKLTREHVTVALNGDGGDENFAGYPGYHYQTLGLWYEHFSLLNKVLSPMSRSLSSFIKTAYLDRVRRFTSAMDEDYRKRVLLFMCYFDNESKDKLYLSKFKSLTKNHDSFDLIESKFDEVKNISKLDQTLYADINTYLPDDLMVKVDIAGMSVALEGRSPFLDHEMLELTAKMPFNLKLRFWNNKKYILKEALRGIIPDKVMFRPKMGFGVPVNRWFKSDLYDYTNDVLLSKKTTNRGLFNRDYIKQLLVQHKHTQLNFSYRIWALLTLELWFRSFF
ncbi:MAG: Asparagine synthetase [Candidatus Amesbacteria bacterium GW2011_GWB1_47_19]|nr:MAG: Asparagine synthetase [Candidatus Amesbacteria bacterium GW2011_GWA1_44_24]KKU31726.1 MAG: asparagine synthase (glutamine-hydrolyzing), asparagine synthase (glutamine-hydrolysing) [Candidatus Amesbacteria bacterium GW2011_GWC1_46_24]KKU67639.1 MAG: Asparagine synthetase [Candidatus Amesbacteria bacterium GW2011_GWB1_47_19]OGD06489.1 MAG: asparagine synthase (glutamine-hydrolyzing) [Candidatus Amesbacteria bacterium RIFOXYB1_FULL_47_13]HBC72892.1 asparagine synthase (glutamine-hydrolyzin